MKGKSLVVVVALVLSLAAANTARAVSTSEITVILQFNEIPNTTFVGLGTTTFGDIRQQVNNGNATSDTSFFDVSVDYRVPNFPAPPSALPGPDLTNNFSVNGSGMLHVTGSGQMWPAAGNSFGPGLNTGQINMSVNGTLVLGPDIAPVPLGGGDVPLIGTFFHNQPQAAPISFGLPPNVQPGVGAFTLIRHDVFSPEPSTIILIGVGLAGLAIGARKRRKK